MDLYVCKIIAWTLADTLEVSTVIATIDKAKVYDTCGNFRLQPDLVETLHRYGLRDSSKTFTPIQVRLIVEALGEP